MQVSAGKVKKPRSRIACKRCHDRRVRCDVSGRGPPCSGCIANNVADACRLLESKRSRGDNGRFSTRATTDATSRTTSLSPVTYGGPDHTESPYSSGSPRPEPADKRAVVQADGLGAEESGRSPGAEADQWSKIISRDRFRVPDSRRVTYLGESWTLSYMSQWKSRGRVVEANDNGSHPASPSEVDNESPDLHVPVPIESHLDTPSPSSTRTSSVMRDQLPRDIRLALVDAYFAYNHGLYPITCEKDFRSSVANGTTSPLLLSAVLYAGALHASDPIIYRAGFDSRQACLGKLYSRAKAIFFDDEHDAGGSDQLPRVQAAFLLHNMWLSPNATMDPWTWLGLAIRLAQNMGMHRSTARSSLPDNDRRLWKRIWWSLYSRDTQIAAALGKPLMINKVDCDVEYLTVDDFESTDTDEVRLFATEQAKLAEICGNIISRRYAPGLRDQPQEAECKSGLMKDLTIWKDHMPQPLQCPRDVPPEDLPIQAMLLQVLFNYLLLLLHRPRMVADSPGTGMENDTTSWKIAFRAAGVITQVTDSIMNYKSLHHCPLFYTSCLFSAMTMHAIRGPSAEHQLGLCMIAMRTLSTMYWAAGWIRNIFQKIGEKQKTNYGYGYGASAASTRAPSPSRQAVAELGRTCTAENDFSADSRAVRHHGPWQPPRSGRQTESGEIPGFASSSGSEPPGLHLPSLSGQPDGHYEWINDVNLTGPGLFTTFGRDDGFPVDYPLVEYADFTGIHPELADCWQELLTADNLFANSFIFGNFSR